MGNSGKLKCDDQNIPTIEISGEGSLKMNDEDKDKVKKHQLQVLRRLSSEGNPFYI